MPQESLYFDFRYRNDYESSILQKDLNDNMFSYERLIRVINSGDTRSQIISGRKYVSLVSCIMHMDINESDIINRASEQASVIRSLLKTRYGIPQECIAFVIDTTQGRRNRVYVDIFDGELPLWRRIQ